MTGEKRSNIDYLTILIPEDKEPTEYKVHERRADLLNAIIEAGGFDLIRYVDYAKKYGKSVSLLTAKDRPILEKYYQGLFNAPKIKTDIFTTLDWCRRQAIHSKDYKAAQQVAINIANIAFNMGIIEKEANRLKVENVLSADEISRIYKETHGKMVEVL